MRYLTIITLLVCSLLYAAAATFNSRAVDQQIATRFRSIIAFGDSMTDNGSFDHFYDTNTRKIDSASLHSYTSPNLTRACDGPVWVEYLAVSLGQTDLYNFARYAASINNSVVLEETPFDLITQVDRYLLSEAADISMNDTIFFIYIGANEVLDIFKLFPEDNEERRQLIEQLILSARFNMERLYTSGAQYMMFLGQLPLEDSPAQSESLPETRAKMGKLVRQFNAQLEENMEEFIINKPGLKAAYFDSYTFFKSLLSPKEIAINSSKTCFLKPSCEGYVYYDSLHPTSHYHALIAEAVYDKLIGLERMDGTE